MSVEDYQNRHLKKWLDAEEKRRTLLIRFEESKVLYLLVLEKQGVDPDDMRKRLEEIEAQNTTKEKQRAFVDATNAALAILVGSEIETAKSAVATVINGEAGGFAEAMERFDALAIVLKEGHGELGMALTEDRQIIYADPKGLNWQEALAVFDERPELFGVIPEVNEE